MVIIYIYKSSSINYIVQSRKELEKRLLTLIDGRVNTLRGDIARESKQRYESIEHLENCLEVWNFIQSYTILNLNLYRMTSPNCKKQSELSQTTEKNWTML